MRQIQIIILEEREDKKEIEEKIALRMVKNWEICKKQKFCSDCPIKPKLEPRFECELYHLKWN